MARPYADAAQAYWRAGWANPIPIRDRDGRPFGKNIPPTGYTGYDGGNVTWPDLMAWIEGDEGGQNIGLRLPGDIVGIDVDAHDGKSGEASIAAAEAELGPLPTTWWSTSRAPFEPSGIRFYRVPHGVVLRGAEKRFVKRFGDHVDIIRRDHRYAVVWPSIHPDTGGTYTWYSAEGEASDIPRPASLTELPAAWVEFLALPVDQEPRQDSESGTGQTSESPWDLPRQFTREQAADFVRPHFKALRAARDGTINNRLNDAAVAIGHFVPTFWSPGQATRWLHEALSHTVYDGKTWRAETTIASGLAADTWKAELLEAPAADPSSTTEDTADAHARALATEVARLHFHAEAREVFDAERHAAGWRPPAAYGSLSDELDLPDDDPSWRFKGLLGTGHNAIVVAARKTGKTTTIDNLVRSYVDAEPFLGRFDVTPTDRAVAIFNYEVDERQYRRWLRESGIVNLDRVFVLHLRGRSLPLKDARVRTWTEAWLREREIGLWIVDPYSRAYVGSLDNGNDEAQVGSFLDTLDVVKAHAGVDELVMPVHTPKARAEVGEESAIGSQRLEGWPDSMWYLTRDLDSGLRFMRAEGRDVDVPEEQLTYDSNTRRLTLGGWDRATLRNRADVEAVLTYIGDNPGCTQRDIMGALSWGATRVKKAVSVAGSQLRTVTGKGDSLCHFVA